MSNLVGYSIVALFVIVMGLLLLLKVYLQTYHPGKYWYIERPIKYLMILGPMFFLFAIGERWHFGENFLPSQNPDDLAWGPFHLGWLFAMVIAIIVVSSGVKADKANTKRYVFGQLNKIDFTVFQFGVLLFGIELYKQLIFLNLYEGLANYHWYGFPLQFCSIPIFLYPLTPFIKNEKIKEAIYSFISIFNLIGGLAVMILATGVYTLQVSISIHTMIWHGVMVVVAFYLINAYKIGTKWRHYLGAVTVLFCLIVLAQLTNVLFHYIGMKFPGPGDFDGFFISPWIDRRNMPILGDIRANMIAGGVPTLIIALVFPHIYFVIFSLTGLLIYYLFHFIWKDLEKNKKEKALKTNTL